MGIKTWGGNESAAGEKKKWECKRHHWLSIRIYNLRFVFVEKITNVHVDSDERKIKGILMQILKSPYIF